MKNFFKNARLTLAMIPTLLNPIGLYMAGDKSVISITTPDGSLYEYSIPDDTKGGYIKLNENTNNPFYVYINKNKDNFMKKLDPPTTSSIAEELELMSLTDKKLLGITHHLFTTKMPNRRIKIQDTALILHLIDEAVQIRAGNTSNHEMSKDKWITVKELIEENVMTGSLKLEKSKSSVAPKQTLQDYVSDTE